MSSSEKNQNIKILIIESNKNDQIAFKNLIKEQKLPYNYTITSSILEAKEILKTQSFDIAITDYIFGNSTASDIFGKTDAPIVVITASGNEEVAVEALRAGAYDYLIKDKKQNYLKVLPVVIEKSLERKKEEKEITMLSHAIMSMGDGIYITNLEGKIIFVNNAFCEVYGYQKNDIIGKNSIVLWSEESKKPDAVHQILTQTLEGNLTEDIYHKRKDGSEFPVFLARSVVKDAKGNKIAALNVTRDVTSRKKVEAVLQRFSFMDGLTGICNRRSFDRILDLELKRATRTSSPISLIMIDIDLFKSYNDTYGHQAGDECLKQLATEINTTLKRSGELVSRYGGEEFAVILPNTDIKNAKQIALLLCEKIENLGIVHSNSNVSNYVTISLGVTSIIPTKNATQDRLISEADKALYQAKQEGRNQVKVYK